MESSESPFTPSEFLSNDPLCFTQILSDEFHPNPGSERREGVLPMMETTVPTFLQSSSFQEYLALDSLSDMKQIRLLVSETMFGSSCDNGGNLIFQKNEGRDGNYIEIDDVDIADVVGPKTDIPSHGELGIDPRSLSISSGYPETGGRLGRKGFTLQTKGEMKNVRSVVPNTIGVTHIKPYEQLGRVSKETKKMTATTGKPTVDPSFSSVLVHKLQKYSDNDDQNGKLRYQEISYRISRTYFH